MTQHTCLYALKTPVNPTKVHCVATASSMKYRHLTVQKFRLTARCVHVQRDVSSKGDVTVTLHGFVRSYIKFRRYYLYVSMLHFIS